MGRRIVATGGAKRNPWWELLPAAHPRVGSADHCCTHALLLCGYPILCPAKAGGHAILARRAHERCQGFQTLDNRPHTSSPGGRTRGPGRSEPFHAECRIFDRERVGSERVSFALPGENPRAHAPQGLKALATGVRPPGEEHAQSEGIRHPLSTPRPWNQRRFQDREDVYGSGLLARPTSVGNRCDIPPVGSRRYTPNNFSTSRLEGSAGESWRISSAASQAVAAISLRLTTISPATTRTRHTARMYRREVWTRSEPSR